MKRKLAFLAVCMLAPLLSLQAAEKKTCLEFDLEYGFNNYISHYASDYSSPFYTETQETGWIPGLSAHLSNISSNGIYSDLNFAFASGKTDYEAYSPYYFTYAGTAGAAYTFGRPELKDTSEYTSVSYGAAIGYVFENNRLQAIPYIGYTIRRWDISMGRISADQEGINFLSYLAYGTGRYTSYEEKYLGYCLPIGLKLNYECTDRLNLGADIAVQFMHKGRLSISGSGFKVYDEPDLRTKPGYRIELPASYRMTPHWALAFKPWLNYEACGKSKLYQLVWSGSISGSTITYQYSVHYKPETDRTQSGLALCLAYTF